MGLLSEDEPAACAVTNETGSSPFLLTADHAGRLVPLALGDLGVSAGEMERHIAWDIGIEGTSLKLAAALDATVVTQRYSRLVIDCNRRPDLPAAFPEISEATPIPGNVALSDAAKQARIEAIFLPYHYEIARQLKLRQDRRTIYVAMHSFTPVYLGVRRQVEIAVLYNRNPRASRILAELLRAEGGLKVGENEPYRVSDETDYGVPVHAERGGLDYVEIEIRQDLIGDEEGQRAWAARLARLLPMVSTALAGTA